MSLADKKKLLWGAKKKVEQPDVSHSHEEVAVPIQVSAALRPHTQPTHCLAWCLRPNLAKRKAVAWCGARPRFTSYPQLEQPARMRLTPGCDAIGRSGDVEWHLGMC